MEELGIRVHWLGHAGFRLESPSGTVVYIDPYKVGSSGKKASAVLITHEHFDHFSKDDIQKVAGPETRVFGPRGLAGKWPGDLTVLEPGQGAEVGDVKIETLPSYNTDKNFHQKAAGNLGYVVDLGDMRVYHSGDTDVIPEMKDVKADVALLPVSGTYTMDVAGAIEAAKIIRPKVAVPMHYGSVVGSEEDALRFENLCGYCAVKILPKE